MSYIMFYIAYIIYWCNKQQDDASQSLPSTRASLHRGYKNWLLRPSGWASFDERDRCVGHGVPLCGNVCGRLPIRFSQWTQLQRYHAPDGGSTWATDAAAIQSMGGRRASCDALKETALPECLQTLGYHRSASGIEADLLGFHKVSRPSWPCVVSRPLGYSFKLSFVFGVSEVVFWVSELAFWVSELILWVSEVVFWVSELILWVSELVFCMSELMLWVSELIPLYFWCLNLCSGCLNLYRCTLGVWTYTLGVWTYTCPAGNVTVGRRASRHPLSCVAKPLGPCLRCWSTTSIIASQVPWSRPR